MSRLTHLATDKRNTGPQQTPDWTVEKLDESLKRQGEAISWARRAKLGEFVKDPFETLDLPLGIRLYFVLTAFWLSFAYGRSTSPFLENMLGLGDGRQIVALMQAPGLALALACVGSSAVCGFLLAPERNRSSFVWAVKGFLGGPLAITQLRDLEALITLGEKEERARR